MRTGPVRLALIAALQVATEAQAVTLVITPDKATYQMGEEIIPQVSGESGAVRDIQVFGRILYDERLAEPVAASQVIMTGFGVVPWLDSGLTNRPGFSDAFSQGAGATELPGDGLSATVTLRALAPGTLDYAWQTEGDLNLILDFFGLQDAPGGSVTIVPEPSTGSLLASGLVAFGAARLRGRASR